MILQSRSAPVPSLQFFQAYASALLEAKQAARQSDPTPQLVAADTKASEVNNNPLSATSGKLEPETQTATAAQVMPVPARPQAIWNRLALLLDQQLMDASQMAGPLGLEFHREAVYVMAALTDEIFVHTDWDGREFWLAHLFEARFFGSHLAGEKFFSRLDYLLSRDDEPAVAIASVYLSALAIGFRGRYWAPQFQDTIDSYRKRLFFFIARRDPQIAEASATLFPAAYRNILQHGTPIKLPDPRRWYMVFAAVVAAWLLVSGVLWYDLSSGLRHRLCCLTPACNESCAPSLSDR